MNMFEMIPQKSSAFVDLSNFKVRGVIELRGGRQPARSATRNSAATSGKQPGLRQRHLAYCVFSNNELPFIRIWCQQKFIASLATQLAGCLSGCNARGAGNKSGVEGEGSCRYWWRLSPSVKMCWLLLKNHLWEFSFDTYHDCLLGPGIRSLDSRSVEASFGILPSIWASFNVSSSRTSLFLPFLDIQLSAFF